MSRAARAEPDLSGDLGRQILTPSYPPVDAADLDPLLDRVGNARHVLLDEASHGTHEYYLWRTCVSQRLLREKGVRFIAVEGDWPACHRLDRYARGERPGGTAGEVLAEAFDRWPT